MRLIRLTYSKTLVRQAVTGFWWRVVGPRFPVALGLVAASVVALRVRGDASWFVGVLGSVLALGVAFVTTLYVVHYRSSMQRLSAMGSGYATLGVSDASFMLSSSAGAATLPWSAVKDVWRLDTCWLLLLSKSQFVTLPLADLDADIRAVILARVRAAGGSV